MVSSDIVVDHLSVVGYSGDRVVHLPDEVPHGAIDGHLTIVISSGAISGDVVAYLLVVVSSGEIVDCIL